MASERDFLNLNEVDYILERIGERKAFLATHVSVSRDGVVGPR